MTTSPVVARLQILGAALLFSTGGAAIKACTLSGWQVACFRSGVAAVGLLLLLPGARRWWKPRTMLVGVAYAATMILYVTGNKLTTAANTIFLQSTAPMYLLLLGPWLLGEPVRRRDWVLTGVLGLGTILFFVGAEPPQATAPNPPLGNVAGALAGLTWALTILGLRWLGREPGEQRESAAAGVVAGNILACVVCLPMAWRIDGAAPADLWLVLYLGFFQIGLAYVFMTRGMRNVPALQASLLLLLEPVLNTVWAWLFHGERPGAWSVAGCSIILVATLALTLALRRGASPLAQGKP